METYKTIPSMGHLYLICFFVDDLLLFAEATTYQIEVIMDYLDKFCDFLGQRVSYPKSSIIFSSTNSLERHLGIPSCNVGPAQFLAAHFLHLSPLGLQPTSFNIEN